MPCSLNLFFDKPINCCHHRCIVRSLFWAIHVSEHRIKFHHKEKVLSILNSDPTPGESGSLLSTVCYESFPNEECISTVLFYALFYTFTQEEIIGCIFNVPSRELEDRRLSLKLIEKFGPCVLQSLSLSRYIKPW